VFCLNASLRYITFCEETRGHKTRKWRCQWRVKRWVETAGKGRRKWRREAGMDAAGERACGQPTRTWRLEWRHRRKSTTNCTETLRVPIFVTVRQRVHSWCLWGCWEAVQRRRDAEWRAERRKSFKHMRLHGLGTRMCVPNGWECGRRWRLVETRERKWRVRGGGVWQRIWIGGGRCGEIGVDLRVWGNAVRPCDRHTLTLVLHTSVLEPHLKELKQLYCSDKYIALQFQM